MDSPVPVFCRGTKNLSEGKKTSRTLELGPYVSGSKTNFEVGDSGPT
jgi:hypothetical protein